MHPDIFVLPLLLGSQFGQPAWEQSLVLQNLYACMGGNSMSLSGCGLLHYAESLLTQTTTAPCQEVSYSLQGGYW